MSEKIPKTFEEKMQVVKELHARSHPDAKKQLSDWEDQMSRLQTQEEWLKHPNTVELKELVIEQIAAIVSMLANDEGIDESDRKALFKLKKAHLTYLALLSIDPRGEMETIEKAIEQELINDES